MARVAYPSGGDRFMSQPSFVDAGSTAAVGTLLSYTAPADRRARVLSYFTRGVAIGVQIAVQFQRGAVTVDVDVPPLSNDMARPQAYIPLSPADVFRIQVTVGVATTTADAFAGIEEEQ